MTGTSGSAAGPSGASAAVPEDLSSTKVVSTVAVRETETTAEAVRAPATGQAVVRMERIGLCGTDHHIWAGQFPASRFPLVQGHEMVGVVAAVGPGVELQLGARVVVDPTSSCGRCFACRSGVREVCARMQVLGVHADGGLRELFLLDATRLHPCPGLDADHAVLVEPASISLEAVRRAYPMPGDLAVVLGAGPIGVLATAGLLERGLEVAMMEPDPTRRELALIAGASLAVDVSEDGHAELRAWCADAGPRLVIEASGAARAFADALQIVVSSGVVVATGLSPATLKLPALLIPYKGIDVRGSRNSRAGMGDAAAFIGRHPSLASALLTHRFPLDRVHEAFALMDSGTTESIGKIMIEVGERPT